MLKVPFLCWLPVAALSVSGGCRTTSAVSIVPTTQAGVVDAKQVPLTQPENNGDWAARWQSARTELERRSTCIDLMDRRVIIVGRRTQTLQMIFGNDYRDWDLNDDGSGYALVFCTPREQQSDRQG